jgi:hypothetical protein
MRFVLFYLATSISVLAGNVASVRDDGLWLDPKGDAVSSFGINYAPMFAHSHRRILELGLDPKKVIDQDVYHFVRMGLNAYRIHVWDIEISDGDGNLLENDHLDGLDYLIAQLRENGIDILLTPMFLGPNGYPEKPTPEPGFASGHHKKEFIPNKAYAAAQLVYLQQLMEHVNPYTGTAYKDEPAIIGIEPVNEPWHDGGKDAIAAHLRNFVEVIRETGWMSTCSPDTMDLPFNGILPVSAAHLKPLTCCLRLTAIRCSSETIPDLLIQPKRSTN